MPGGVPPSQVFHDGAGVFCRLEPEVAVVVVEPQEHEKTAVEYPVIVVRKIELLGVPTHQVANILAGPQVVRSVLDLPPQIVARWFIDDSDPLDPLALTCLFGLP